VTRVGPEVNTVAAGAGKSRCVDQSGLFSSACREISSYREAKTTKGQTIPKRTEPAFFEPMQCKPVTALPAGVKWTFEIKFDGYRCIVVKRRREVTLFSRHKKVLNKRFPSVVEALALLEGDFVLDGEPVALDSQGKPLQLLQHSISQSLPIYFYAFELLIQNGELLVNLPLSRRRELLESLLAAPKNPLRLSPR
jgi:bifunctional non-homologous end joining protein LigD